MRVNSISNVSFEAKKAKMKKNNEQKEQYYKWVSQNQVNQTLKMAKGREVENGKFEAAKAVGTLVAFAAGMYTVFNSIKTGNIQRSIQEVTPQITKMKNKSLIALGVTAVALNTRNVLDILNRKNADKTANERGFLTSRQEGKVRNVQQSYNIAEAIYNKNVQ